MVQVPAGAPSALEVERVAQRAREAGVPVERVGERGTAIRLRDPAGVGVVVAVGEQAG